MLYKETDINIYWDIYKNKYRNEFIKVNMVQLWYSVGIKRIERSFLNTFILIYSSCYETTIYL